MRKVIVPLYDEYTEGLTVGYREKSAEVAILFRLKDGSDLIEWYDWTKVQFI